jgi:hypothetical protein
LPIIRSPRTQSDIDEAWANWSPVRHFTSGSELNSGGYGFVYLLLAENGEYKIGRSKHSGQSRCRAVANQLKLRVELLAEIPTFQQVWAEYYLQTKHRHCLLHGEWYALSTDEVAWICALSRLDMESQDIPKM